MALSGTAAFPIICVLNMQVAPTSSPNLQLEKLPAAPFEIKTFQSPLPPFSPAEFRSSLIEGIAQSPLARGDRETTENERIAGELRRFGMLSAGWDGDGAAAPMRSSVREAVAFVGLLSNSELPEPMLHATGRAGLFWKTSSLYAELEFLGDERLAYFIERGGDKHKGVLNFDRAKMPAVLDALLQV